MRIKISFALSIISLIVSGCLTTYIVLDKRKLDEQKIGGIHVESTKIMIDEQDLKTKNFQYARLLEIRSIGVVISSI